MKYYKLCKALNKVNLCWVLSEGRKGHEIQSMTVAEQLSHNITIQHFKIRQPWLSFTPRITPGFIHGIQWKQSIDLTAAPRLIITTGRKAAAAGKHIKQLLRASATPVHHIQILNPKDSLSRYDLVLIPDHDQIKRPNVINFSGSLHPYSKQWFQTTSQHKKNKFIALIIGNPVKDYFNQKFSEELAQIHSLYPDVHIMVCGSPRLHPGLIHEVKELCGKHVQFWFTPNDGDNPYQAILQQAQHIFVTTDSINMMNECAASSALVSLLAQAYTPSPKHHRFMRSLNHRWSGFTTNPPSSFQAPFALDQILASTRLQNLLNSPHSFNAG